MSPTGRAGGHLHQQGGGGNALPAEALLDMPGRGMWVGTFHGIAHRLLRMHWEDAGLPQNFQIIDADDQQRLIGGSCKALDLDEQRMAGAPGRWVHQRAEGRRPQAPTRFRAATTFRRRHWKRLYEAYEAACARAAWWTSPNCCCAATNCLRDNEALLTHYRRRFGQHPGG